MLSGFEKKYLCIDLKSFFSSVECVERGLDPMTTDLVVADPDRGGGTICLAVSPSLRAKGVRNRCRVFEIPPGLNYIMATPHMKKYIEYAAEIYGVYLDYIAAEDMHVYSIDEVFIDVTPYLKLYNKSAREMALFLMEEVRKRIGVRATAGVGTNLYLAKIALDIIAKNATDFIGELDEEKFKSELWDYRPLSDFWRIGPATQRKLHSIGVETMRGIAMTDETLLYKMFGIDAELMIDHAYGIEPTTIADIHNYHTHSHSLSSGQVLFHDYNYDEGLVIIKEMAENLAMMLSEQGLAASKYTLALGYSSKHQMPLVRASFNLPVPSNITKELVNGFVNVYEGLMDSRLTIRRVFVNANNVTSDSNGTQINFIQDYPELASDASVSTVSQEQSLQRTISEIKRKMGKNAIFKGVNLSEAGTMLERNKQIGGHRE